MRSIKRREVIRGATTIGLIAATGTHALSRAAETKSARGDLIQRENAKVGTRDSMLTKTRTMSGKLNKIRYTATVYDGSKDNVVFNAATI